jgi:hypothetical protein
LIGLAFYQYIGISRGTIMPNAKTSSRRSHNLRGLTLIELLVVVLVLAGITWGVKALLFGSKQGKVDVRVWITTQSGESIKLGNVPVICLPESAFKNTVGLANGLAERNAARLNDLIEDDKKTIQLAAVAGSSQAEVEHLKRAMRQDVADYNNQRNYHLHDVILKAVTEGNGVRQALFYTDDEGKVSIGVPDKRATYYVLAITQRTAGDTTEKDCWLERITPAATSNLQFSNNNLWDIPTQGAAYGVTVLPELPAYPWLN